MAAEHERRVPAAPPLGEAALRRGLNVNILAGSLGMMWAAVMGIPLTMFMERIGASGVLIGLTASVQQIAMLLQIPSALYAARLPERKPYWAALVLTQRIMWFAPAFLAAFVRPGRTAALLMVALAAVSACLAHAAAAPWWSWMTELVPERLRGSFWGRRQALVNAAHLFAVWGSGYILDLFPDPRQPGGSFLGFALVFALSAVLGSADIITHLWVPEPRQQVPRRTESLWKQVVAPLRSRDFVWVTVATGVWTFGVGLVGQFTILYLKREFSVTYTQLSATTIVALVGVILSGVLWGYVMDRLGARNLGVVTMAVAPLFSFVWFFMRSGMVTVRLPLLPSFVLPQAIVLLLVVNMFSGMFHSGVGLSQVGLLTGAAPAENRTVAMALHWSVVGLLAALGPLAGGAFMDWTAAHPFGWTLPSGTPFSFLHALVLMYMAVSWLGAVPVLLRVRRRPGEVGVRTAFARMMVGNPWRALSSLYSIVTVNVAVSSRRRASAVSRLGAERTALAVRDLIASLDDPAAEVREAAVAALGRIGGPEAVDALLARLNDPQSDLMPQIARALRDTRSPRSVDSLMRKLTDSDRETVAEAARTLGELGDRRAAASLLKLLRGATDSKVVFAAGGALARLGEIAAIYEILPRMCETSNPVLKRSLAVMVGDLLGQAGQFYGVLVQDQRAHGVEALRLLRRLSDRIEEVSRGGMEEQGRQLVIRLAGLRAAYEAGEPRRCVDLLFSTAVGLSALRYGMEFGGDVAVFTDTLVWHDEKFGVTVWFLALLRDRLAADPQRPVDLTDVLLGIYALSAWSGDKPSAEP